MRIGDDQKIERLEPFHRFRDARDAVAGVTLHEHRAHVVLLRDLILRQQVAASNQRVSGMPGVSMIFLSSKRDTNQS